mmetsp:Transcript_34955/g.56442  ORF Transcript_34955/g.56442 Transcript_34955/m.56442 type:complete len:442 (+) Transcript_34955:50-1375(+)|eukprot:CAMPEP_0179410454 /NCGR_PEP_ID=MMETSP0799-20121207/3296_1 /TAXON_ID=46947 /ORGANISM="Geminigera cryophila, Strain CCMP2564" /LENGTH=441 /DNA_ID=CAMNT_0021182305 /DNA_START=105 /DNA_END=1430 /DNA_ORIENTATION=+
MSRPTEIMDAGNALAWWTSSTMGPVRSATCGMFAGAALVAVEHPLQTVRQNASPPTASSNVASRASTWVSAKNMVKAQGIRAVYRGASSPLLASVTSSGLLFASYEVVRRNMQARHPDQILSPFEVAQSGTIAGAFTKVLTTSWKAQPHQVCGGLKRLVQHHLCVVSRAALSTGVFFGVANFIRSHATDPCSSGPGVVAVLCGGAGGSIASSITDASLEHLFNQSSSKTNLHVTPQQLVNHVAVAHGGVTVPTPLTMAPLVEMPLDLVAANLKPIALALAEHSGENLTFGAAESISTAAADLAVSARPIALAISEISLESLSSLCARPPLVAVAAGTANSLASHATSALPRAASAEVPFAATAVAGLVASFAIVDLSFAVTPATGSASSAVRGRGVVSMSQLSAAAVEGAARMVPWAQGLARSLPGTMVFVVTAFQVNKFM